MTSLKLPQLVEKLDKPVRQALKWSTGLCVQQHHY